MARRIYIFVGLIALAIMIFFILNPRQMSVRSLVWVVTLLFAVVVGCMHGAISHSLTSKQKGNLMFYPVIMGMLFAILVFIYLYLVLPQVIPGFM
jgi:hypothetical protein